MSYNGIVVGDIVKDINPTWPNYGCTGVVTSVNGNNITWRHENTSELITDMRNDLIKFVNKNKDLKELIRKKPEDIEIQEDVDEVLPDDLTIKEQAVFFYKKCNYKDFEIRDILNLEKNEYRQIVKSCYQKISEANG